jgi:hypothetical protein
MTIEEPLTIITTVIPHQMIAMNLMATTIKALAVLKVGTLVSKTKMRTPVLNKMQSPLYR